MVKENIDVIAPVITKIVNESLELNQFYDHWKLAFVTPLIKKHGLPLEWKNYLPVSNLSFLSKIAEKTVIYHFNDHLSKNNLHSCHLSAYKPNFSTETA